MSVLRLSENETDPGAAGGDIGGGAPVADPVDAGEPDQADEWSAPSREDWESTQSTLSQLQEQIEFQQQYLPQAAFQQQQPQYQQQPQGPTIPDRYAADDVTYARELAEFVQFYARQEVQPYRQVAETWREREGEARAQDMIHDDVSKNGDYIVPDASAEKVKTLANAYFNATTAQLHQQGIADEARFGQAAAQAYETAIGEVRAYEKQIGDAAVERYKNQLAGLDPRRQQLPVSGDAPAQGFPAPGGGDEMALVRRYTAGQGLPS